jgi:serine/threonine protein kinase
METAQTAGIWSRYQPRSLIGQGVYGKVHKAICMETNRTVAIKETLSDIDGILPTTMRELAILAQVEHPNVVKYLPLTRMIEADQCMINNQVFIVMEYCEQDLSQFIRTRMEVLLDPLVVQDFLYQILSGVEAIHKCRLVHRDIKPGLMKLTKQIF